MTRDPPRGVTIRPRQDGDLPALEALLLKQQPASEYPIVWPLPGGTRDFIARRSELHSWVAELESGDIVGHIAITRVDEVEGADLMAPLWEAGHGGVHTDQLRQVCVFFTDLDHSGSGVGHHLFDTAVQVACREGYPVLDVVDTHPGPIRFYEKRGWKIVGRQGVPWDPDSPAHAFAMVLPREDAAKPATSQEDKTSEKAASIGGASDGILGA